MVWGSKRRRTSSPSYRRVATPLTFVVGGVVNFAHRAVFWALLAQNSRERHYAEAY